jgi:riboflavin kinase/FMN adenylyltransferase
MKVIHAANELKAEGKKVCLAIGFFDGVHLGHQQIIRQTISDARQHDALAVVLTFDRHPNSIVAPDKVPPLIYSLPQKLRAIELLGVDALLLIEFDKKFSGQTGEEFIRSLTHDFGKIHSVCVGADFVFGHKRSGNVELLKKLGGEIGFQVHGLAAVSLDGQVLSSTRIRETIRAGDFDAASQMLGRPYAISGRVVEGDRLGRQLGFPTANLDAANLMLPPTGFIRAVHKTWQGKLYRVALNIGLRPTVASAAPHLRVEAHLAGF